MRTMQDLKRDPLVVTAVHSFLGALGGMLSAIVFLYLIMGIGSLLPTYGTEEMGGGPPPFVAMAAGSVVGAILGGVVGLRKSK